jgi:predicted enzyme related to lactoylglutathione lyase
MAKVTGIGGVFFKSTTDNKALAAWYRDNLGMNIEDWGGAILRWTDDAVKDGGLTVWTTAAPNSKWFAPSESNFMINYRVDDLTRLLAQLKEAGIEPVAGPDSAENGKFAWIMDPDGNKVELWEPMAWDDANKKG